MNNTQAMDDEMESATNNEYGFNEYDYYVADDNYSKSMFEKTSKNTKLTSNEYNETKKMRDTQRKKERSMKRNWEGV